MREIRSNWRDLFLVFRLALDLKKMALGMFVAIVLLILCTVGFVLTMWDIASEQADVEVAFRAAVEARADRSDAATLALGAEVPFVAFEGRSFFTFVNDWFADGRTEDRARLQLLVDMTKAEWGIGTAGSPDHPDVTYTPRGVTAGKVLMVLVFGLVGWWFISLQLLAISRIAAVEIARDERLGFSDGRAYARKRHATVWVTPVSGLVFICVVLLLLAGWAWLAGLVPWVGPILAAITFPIALFGGFLAALATVGLVLGWPLTVPAVAVEGTDSFDAISRSFSYVFSRPLHYATYVLIAAVHGVLSTAVVCGFLVLMLAAVAIPAVWAWGEPFAQVLATVLPSDTLYGIVTLGAPLPAETGLAAMSDGSGTIVFGVAGFVFALVIAGAAVGYAISYATAAWTMIYMLLRKRTDGTDPVEVYVDEEGDVWLPPPSITEQALVDTALPAGARS